MAFTTAQKLSIAEIIGWTAAEVDVHLISAAPTISADAEAAVIALIAEYDDLDADDGLEIFPNVANFGARVYNTRSTAEIRIKNTLFGLLNIERSSEFQSYLERG